MGDFVNHSYLPPTVGPWTVIGGVLGAVVSGLLVWQSPMEFLRKLVIGVCASLCLTPLFWPMIAGMLRLPPTLTDAGMMGAGFIVGLTGLLIIEAIVQLVKAGLTKVGADDDEASH